VTIVPEATHLFEEPGAPEQVACLAASWFSTLRQLPQTMSLCILLYKNRAESIRIANDTPYALAAYICSKDPTRSAGVGRGADGLRDPLEIKAGLRVNGALTHS